MTRRKVAKGKFYGVKKKNIWDTNVDNKVTSELVAAKTDSKVFDQTFR